MSADCDNCFLGFSGLAFIDIEFSFFRLKEAQAGFKNMQLKGGLGVSLTSSNAWSYSFDKIYPIVKSFDIASFYIGPVKIHAWCEVPVELILDASANIFGQIKYGENLNVNIGGLYFDYTSGSGFHVVKPKLVTSMTSYSSATATGNGEAHFKIIPSVNFYVNNIFRFTTTLTPEIDASIDASLSSKQICVSSKYNINAKIDGQIIDYKFSDTIYDSGIVPIEKVCKNM